MMPASQPADRGRPYAHAFDLYWSAGWRGVIPVRGKYPPPENYTGATGLWPSYADAFTWSDSAQGGLNIALRLPENVIGIDVDNYDGKRGGATLFDCQVLWGELPHTYRSTSRDDGISGIRLYRIPAGLSWPGQLPGGGVELIRWDHRYCVCWPSLHPKTSRVYRWIAPGGVVLANVVPAISDLPDLPESWVNGLSRGEWQSEAKADLSSSATAAFLFGLSGAEEEPCPRIEYVAARLISSLVVESRHDAARDGVLNLIRLGEEGHPGIVNVLRRVSDAFVIAVTADGTRSVNVAASEFTRNVDGAIRLVASKPRTPSIGDPCIVLSDPPWTPAEPLDSRGHRIMHDQPVSAVSGDLRAAEQGPALDALTADRLRWRRADREALRLLDLEDQPPIEQPPQALSLFDFLAEHIERPPYVIDQVLPSGARILLAAQHKAGKTTLVGNLVRSICDGVPFLGFDVDVPDGQGAAILDFEMDPFTLHRWLTAMRIEHPDRALIFPLLGKVRQFDIRDDRVMALWVERLKGVGTVIIDCLKPILDQLNLDEHHDTGKFTTPLTELKDAAGIKQLILVHHMGHNGERSRGDSALRGWPEAEWMLVRMADDPDKEAALDAPRYFKAYGRDVNVPECQIGYDAETRRLSIVGQKSRGEARKEYQDSKMQSVILDIVRAQPGVLLGELPGLARAAGQRGRNELIIGAAKALIEAKMIKVKLGGPTNRSHHLFPHSE